MSTDGKIKTYKNPERNKTTTAKPYVPQYQIRGVEPEVYNSPMAPGYGSITRAAGSLPKTNPRATRPVIRQPYAEVVPSPIGRGKGPIPNVGNNMEQTWSSVDGDIIDDISDEVDPNHPMIDNNDYISSAALGLSDLEVMEEAETTQEVETTQEPPKEFLTKDELQNAIQDEQVLDFSNLKENEYVLVVRGIIACSGELESIQETTRAMVFGGDHLWPHEPISIDDIVILKRVKLKVGLFLE